MQPFPFSPSCVSQVGPAGVSSCIALSESLCSQLLQPRLLPKALAMPFNSDIEPLGPSLTSSVNASQSFLPHAVPVPGPTGLSYRLPR